MRRNWSGFAAKRNKRVRSLEKFYSKASIFTPKITKKPLLNKTYNGNNPALFKSPNLKRRTAVLGLTNSNGVGFFPHNLTDMQLGDSESDDESEPRKRLVQVKNAENKKKNSSNNFEYFILKEETATVSFFFSISSL